MNKSLIDEDWYSIDTKILRQMEAITEKQDEIISACSTLENINKKQDEMTSKLNNLENKVQMIVTKLEARENKPSKDYKAIADLLQELKVIKEREINVLLREKIPFPFMFSKPIVTTPNSFMIRRPFSKKE